MNTTYSNLKKYDYGALSRLGVLQCGQARSERLNLRGLLLDSGHQLPLGEHSLVLPFETSTVSREFVNLLHRAYASLTRAFILVNVIGAPL